MFGYLREGMSEALTAVHAGRVLSRVISYVTIQSADAVVKVGRQHWGCRSRKACPGSFTDSRPPHRVVTC